MSTGTVRDLDDRIHVLMREVPGSGGQAFLGKENFRSTEVVTNTETGRWMVVDRAGSLKEFAATHQPPTAPTDPRPTVPPSGVPA